MDPPAATATDALEVAAPPRKRRGTRLVEYILHFTICLMFLSLLKLEPIARNSVQNSNSMIDLPSQPLHTIRRNTTNFSTRFSLNMQLNVDRGLNIINAWSGHQMAAFIYEGVGGSSLKKHLRTWVDEPQDKLLRFTTDSTKLSAGDTLFVSYAVLKEFVNDFLPQISTPIVLFTARWCDTHHNLGWLDDVAGNITNHDQILKWFAVDAQLYTGGQYNNEKVSPFPLGLKPNMKRVGMGVGKPFQNPIPYYRRMLLKVLNDTGFDTKTNPVFVGQISRTSSSRANIPSGKRLDYPKYLEELAKSSYVISPDGAHPDCHRHYEALGLGVVPITQLDPAAYSHLKDAVIFNQQNYSLAHLMATLSFPAPKVNRNLIFEEYWMEYVEKVVGQELWWWDVAGGKRSKLLTFTNKTSLPE